MSAISTIKPVDDQTRRGQIVRNLRELILGGDIMPGTRLTETDLATRLGVSRAPVREAIRELVDIGLVVSLPYKGLFVRTVTRLDLEELYSLRTVLEQFAFTQAWEKRTEAQCDDLRMRNRRLIEAIENHDGLGAIEMELDLHSWCYELSNHRLLQTEWTRMRHNLQFYFILHQKAHGRSGPRRKSHDIYVDCACGDDLSAMMEHLSTHMRQGLKTTLNFIE